MIHLTSDYSALDREMNRIAAMPTRKMKAYLDTVLDATFAEAQALVHIDTGSLKDSGKKSSDTDPTKWTGTMRWGGPSAGVNNPVDYAIYELRRGGPHDWLVNVHLLDNLYATAILIGLRG
jgi:hypothetical protein